MVEDKTEWVKVYTIFDEVAAQIVKGLLEDSGIAVDVFYYQAGSILSAVSAATAKGEIRVKSSLSEKARGIIADFEAKGFKL
jgi:hypothetical protein